MHMPAPMAIYMHANPHAYGKGRSAAIRRCALPARGARAEALPWMLRMAARAMAMASTSPKGAVVAVLGIRIKPWLQPPSTAPRMRAQPRAPIPQTKRPQ